MSITGKINLESEALIALDKSQALTTTAGGNGGLDDVTLGINWFSCDGMSNQGENCTNGWSCEGSKNIDHCKNVRDCDAGSNPQECANSRNCAP